MTKQLIYEDDTKPGITRRHYGRGFAYFDTHGRRLRSQTEEQRIRRLAIPPAWTNVWISPREKAHLQATGRDARGRKQYRYHPDFRAHKEEEKFAHVLEFARVLPAIRRTVQRHMGLKGLPRQKVLATIVWLLEKTLIRIGNEDYARQNHSYGLTTLRDPHVAVRGSELRFHFKGKSGKIWRLQIANRRVAKIVKACQDLPGQHLFQYDDSDGTIREVSSSDVNTYLRDITGQDITAKDFRTWAGTVLAAMALTELSSADNELAAKRNIRDAIASVASQLGNTPTICRKCYVHPVILESYLADELVATLKQRTHEKLTKISRLKPEEAAVLALLQARLNKRSRKSSTVR